MSPIGVLFDLDGVLIDSETLYTRFWNEIERKYPTGIPDFALAIKGTTLSKILELYPEGEIRDAIVERIHQFEDVIRYNICPGVPEFLADLKEHNVPMAIVTSSDDVKMKCLFSQLPELRPWFDAVVDGSMITRSKPDPEPYLLGARLIGVPPADCVVFEDSFQGIESGRAAGCRVIGVASTFPRGRMLGHTPTVIDSFRDMTFGRMMSLVSKP